MVMGWVHPWVELGWVENCYYYNYYSISRALLAAVYPLFYFKQQPNKWFCRLSVACQSCLTIMCSDLYDKTKQRP